MAVLLNMAVLSADDKPHLTLKADPKVALLGVPVMVHATVSPHPDVRVARIQYPFGGSSWQVEGALRAERRSFVFRLPEGGEHEIFLVVYNQEGQELARKRVTVQRLAPDTP